MSTPVETIVWIAEDTPAYQEGFSSGCDPKPIEGKLLPQGLRGVATPAREACGSGWLFVHFDVPHQPSTRSHHYYVRADAVRTTAPKGDVEKAKSTGSAYTRQAGANPTLAIPLDDPQWLTPALVPGGEVVERLGMDRIRTASGHELWIDPFYLGDVDPLGRSDYSASAASVPLRRRFVAGLATREIKAPLTWLPAAATLGPAQKGRVYMFNLRPEWIMDSVFSPEWFDPVGQTLDHACGKNPASDEPCGRYDLDYAAFGAWLPTKSSIDVVAMWTGARLEVMVIEPWGDDVEVSPSWDSPK